MRRATAARQAWHYDVEHQTSLRRQQAEGTQRPTRKAATEREGNAARKALRSPSAWGRVGRHARPTRNLGGSAATPNQAMSASRPLATPHAEALAGNRSAAKPHAQAWQKRSPVCRVDSKAPHPAESPCVKRMDTHCALVNRWHAAAHSTHDARPWLQVHASNNRPSASRTHMQLALRAPTPSQ